MSNGKIIRGAQTIGTERDGNNVRLLKSVPASQVGGGEGPRYYVGESNTPSISHGRNFANAQALKKIYNQSDSTSYKAAITQFPDLSSHWARSDTHREEFFRQWGYDPKNMPKDKDGYNLYHDEMLELLEKANKKEFNLLDFIKIGGGKK